MEVVNKKLVLVVIIIGIFCTFFIWQNISDNKTKLEIVSLNNETKSSSMFAIMLEEIDEDGNLTYIESTDSAWPSTAIYSYDEVRSGCMDTNGNKIENVLTYDEENNKASVETGNTSYCYLYFEIIPNLYKLCKDYNNLNECMLNEYNLNLKNVPNITQDEIENTGGMRRYQGTTADVTNNYICFGTDDLETCTSDTEKYMYRIIGITGEGNFKLIKNSSLGMYQWHNNNMDGATWINSDLFKRLNGLETDNAESIFVNSSSYEYLTESSEWYNKILNINWKYGDARNNGNYNGDEIYAIEDGFTNIINAKIGLMYIHDYYYAYFGGNPGENIEAQKSWMYLKIHDWTMTRYGTYENNNLYYSWYISANDGHVGFWYLYTSTNVRPVFYLSNSNKIIRGTGTISNPYLIS